MSTQNVPEGELIDLPEEDERPRVNICSPKLVVVTIFAVYFFSQNIYSYIMNPPAPVEQSKITDEESWQNFWNLWDRFQSYVYVTIFAFIAFYYLRNSNDQVEEQAYLLQKEKEKEVEERERKLQAEREERIIKKLEEEERQEEAKQYRAAERFKQQFQSEEERMKKD